MWYGDKDTKEACATVGDLLDALAFIREDTPLDCEGECAVEIQVFRNGEDKEECHLSIRGVDIDE